MSVLDQIKAALRPEKSWIGSTYVNESGRILGEVSWAIRSGRVRWDALVDGWPIGSYVTEESAKNAVERRA